jgi:hypothetical protein
LLLEFDQKKCLAKKTPLEIPLWQIVNSSSPKKKRSNKCKIIYFFAQSSLESLKKMQKKRQREKNGQLSSNNCNFQGQERLNVEYMYCKSLKVIEGYILSPH